MKKSIIYFIGLFLFISCSKKTDKKVLHEAAAYPVGTAVGRWLYNDSATTSLMNEQFNSVTAEGIMKMNNIRPEENEYRWGKIDELVLFCQNNDKRLHGHTLVWWRNVPEWLKEYEGDSARVEQVIKDHIHKVVTRYKGKVTSWDVVNEALSDFKGTIEWNFFGNTLGKDYVARAFQYAREADPDVKLFYNDYWLWWDSTKLENCLAMIDDFQERGIPIDGIGLQSHVYINHPPLSMLEYALKEFAKRNLLIHLSEVDISFNEWFYKEDSLKPEYTAINDSLLQWQGERYRQIAEAYTRIVPEELQFGITVWGFTDKRTWIRNHIDLMDWPCLFDEQLNPKPAYFGFKKGLSGK